MRHNLLKLWLNVQNYLKKSILLSGLWWAMEGGKKTKVFN